jgi:mannose-1-phosphate guanylyltransferase
LLKKQLTGWPSDQFIVEPEPRDTAPAIGLAAWTIASRFGGQEVVMTINSDQYVGDLGQYKKTLQQAEKIVTKYPEQILLIGVKPDYPETGFGYIQLGKSLGRVSGQEYFKVKKFIEKPPLVKAKQYCQSGQYLWNPAFFVFQSGLLQKLYRKNLPADAAQLDLIIKKPNLIKKIFPALTKISIDYAIMEKADNLIVLPGNFNWLDIGNWQAVWQILEKQNKFPKAFQVSVDQSKNLIYTEKNKLVATLGVADSVIVDTPDVLLVCHKESAARVKELIAAIKKNKKFHKYL